MAFISGVQAMRDIGKRCVELGAHVIFEPGWETRGNGQQWPAGGPKGHINHHTGGGRNIYLDRNLIHGVPGLSGPLCNFAILYDGDICLVSAFPANHAGASGGWDTAPLPHTGWFNREVFGTEIQYPGVEPMTDLQYRNMIILNRAMMDVMGWSTHDVLKTHQGTSITGKWDTGYAPGKTYDIHKIRRETQALLKRKDDPLMALDDKQQNEILEGARTLAGKHQSFVDLRNPVKGRAPFEATIPWYILEADAKLYKMASQVDELEKDIAAILAAMTQKKEGK